MNRVELTGRITKDLEIRMTSKGTQVLNLNLAVNNAKDDTTFFKINCFNKLAESVNKYCSKGDLIEVEAMVKNNDWTDENGSKHYDYTFIANRVGFLNTTKKEIKEEQIEVVKEETQEPVQENDPYEEFANEVNADDLPF